MHSAQYSKALPLLTEQLETLRSQAVRDEAVGVRDLLRCRLRDYSNCTHKSNHWRVLCSGISYCRQPSNARGSA